MGHLGNLKEEYRELVRRLGAGTVALPEPRDPRAWQGWKEILEILYTPEEADLASRLPLKPMSLERIAKRVGVAPEELRPRLDRMCDKGLVLDLVSARTGATKYLLAPPVAGFFEFSMMRVHDGIPKKRMAEALYAYTHFDEAFVDEVFRGGEVIGRSLVHETALDEAAEPEVLDWQRATAVVEDARERAVSLCYCRHEASHRGAACDAPMENCLSLGGGASFVIRRKFGRAVDKSEALEILHRAREGGLVQIADNVRERPVYICNCCGCCCAQLQGINRWDLKAVNPSGFIPVVDATTCKGCSRCSRACPVTALTMTARRVDAKRKNQLVPKLDEERCIGCGVCADQCKNHAMKMASSGKRPSVPVDMIERTVRTMLAKGRLAELLFDEGDSRGSRFLHRAVKALTQLPLADRALATEQLRSRFVRFALQNVKDPTV